jgi:peptidoglycan/xylan/chitin deacetylase (PgdA/CDA1 family)
MSLTTRIRNRCQREMAARLACRMAPINLTEPVVSFTFDDFPRSALYQGGAILRNHDMLGTYYASFGLMGQAAPTGEIFFEEDLFEFKQQGHELGCHTFDHCHSWDTAPAEFEASILRNQQRIARISEAPSITSFSYPISCPRPDTKRRTAKYYATARGGGQTFNIRSTDLNYLKAFFIEQSRDNFAAIQQVIDDNARAKGWLIFATHDVCDTPTRYGCTPALFERIVKAVAKSGAKVLPINQAFALLSGKIGALGSTGVPPVGSRVSRES